MTDKAYALAGRRLIVTLQLPPGAVLSEIVLAKRLATGRTPIRRLRSGLLARRPGEYPAAPWRAMLVSDIDLSAQLQAARGCAGSWSDLMARGAAKRATAADERARKFADIGRGMRVAADKEDDLAFMRLDQQFNMLIVVQPVRATSSAMRAMG